MVNLDLNKDLKVFKVGLRWSCNTFFSLPIEVLFPKLTINEGKERETFVLISFKEGKDAWDKK
jgi:hypothetical protein